MESGRLVGEDSEDGHGAGQRQDVPRNGGGTGWGRGRTVSRPGRAELQDEVKSAGIERLHRIRFSHARAIRR